MEFVVAKFRQCRFFSDKRCKVWYDTYKRGSVFTDPGRNSILYPVFEKRDPCGNAKAVSFEAGPDQRRRFCMRKRLFAIVLALTAAVGISGGTASGAVRSAQVDTITMDAEMPDDEVEVDLGWKNPAG